MKCLKNYARIIIDFEIDKWRWLVRKIKVLLFVLLLSSFEICGAYQPIERFFEIKDKRDFSEFIENFSFHFSPFSFGFIDFYFFNEYDLLIKTVPEVVEIDWKVRSIFEDEIGENKIEKHRSLKKLELISISNTIENPLSFIGYKIGSFPITFVLRVDVSGIKKKNESKLLNELLDSQEQGRKMIFKVKLSERKNIQIQSVISDDSRVSFLVTMAVALYAYSYINNSNAIPIAK